jgi:hypothetical protein
MALSDQVIGTNIGVDQAAIKQKIADMQNQVAGVQQKLTNATQAGYTGNQQIPATVLNAPVQPKAPTGVFTGESATGGYDFGNAMQTAIDRLNTINPLTNVRQLLIKQMYDEPLSPEELQSMPIEYQQMVNNGDKQELEMGIRMLNDDISGRMGTMDKSVQFLTNLYTTGQTDLETKKQQAISNILDFANIYGSNTKTVLESIYSQTTLDNLKNMNIDIDKLGTIPTLAETKAAVGTGDTTGIGTIGSPEIDTSTAGYTTAIVGSTGMTQAAIDQSAMQYATTGVMPSIGLGSTGQAANKRNAIQNRAAELSQGTTIATTKANLAANQIALSDQVKAMNNVQAALNAADTNFQQVLDSFTGSGLNPSDSTILNKKIAWIRKNLTGGNQFSFDAGIQEVKNDYAIVFSRGGQVTDQARQQADQAINDKISFKDLKAIHEQLNSLGKEIVKARQIQIADIQKLISNPFGNATTTGGSYTEGQTATDANGNKIIFKGGSWVKQ